MSTGPVATTTGVADTSPCQPADVKPSWQPLPQMQHAKVIKSFLPLDKHPSLKLNAPYYKNLYYGDEVFLFETLGEKWARGYLIVQPMPIDFIEKSSDLDKLPEQTVSIVVLPWKCVKKLKGYPLFSNFSPPDQNDFEHSHSKVPSVYEWENARMKEEFEAKGQIHLKPPLPLIRLQAGDLLDELIPSLNQLSSHIFSLYSVAEYELYVKLYRLFIKLYGLRLQLFNNLLTENESYQAKRQISVILTNISKLLSSKGKYKFSKASSALKTDPSGFEAITARDVDSGELYNYQHPDLAQRPIPKFIAGNQIASALQPNFPIQSTLEADMTPSRKNKFDIVTPSQVLVDFRDVSGRSTLNPKGFIGMTAYLYLRTPRKRLTEAFAIHINQASDFNLESISAALFRNIPGTDIVSSRIYLVAIITERIQVPTGVNTNPLDVLNYYRKGIAAGAVDISRVFNLREGSLQSGQSHDFSIRLFGSYVNPNDNTTLDPVNMNFGWGELIDRIIKGQKKGVAINPRAERLIVSIKEFRDDLRSVENAFELSVKTPINQIRTCVFDPLVEPHDRVYFSVGKVNLLQQQHSEFPGDLISLQLRNDDADSEIVISKATNEEFGTLWNFPSVYSNEVVGEVIKFSNLTDLRKNNESFSLKLFVNGEYKSKVEVPVVFNGTIHEFPKNSLLIFFDTKGQKFASAEVTAEYIGKAYNISDCFSNILNFERYYQFPEDEDKIVDTLKLLNQTKLPELIKFFKPLIPKLLKIFELASKLNLTKLEHAAYYSFIHLFDVVIARGEQYTYLYHEFIAEIEEYHLPKVGILLLSISEGYFSNVSIEWNFVGRTLCRVLPLLLKISSRLVVPLDKCQFQDSVRRLLETLKMFINLNRGEKNVSDQLVILDYFDLLMNNLYEDQVFSCESAIGVFIDFIGNVNATESDQDEGTNGINSGMIRSRESKIMISKLLLIRKVINSWVLEFEQLPEISIKFYFSATNWAIETFSIFPNDMDVLRVANSCLVSICNTAWKIVVSPQNEANSVIPMNLSRILLKIGSIFSKLHIHLESDGHLFKAKRVYTQVFPNTYPFKDMIIDSIVNETVLVEVLVELGVIYAFVIKVAKGVLQSLPAHSGILTILERRSTDIEELSNNDHFSLEFNKEDLLTIIETNALLASSSFYPQTKWISLYSLFIEATTSSSELIQPVMITQHIPVMADSSSFDRALWSKYLKSVLSFATSAPASSCHLADVPRKAAFKIAADLRTRCASVIKTCWDQLGWNSLERDLVRFQLTKSAGYHAEFIEDDQEELGILQELMVFCLQRNSHCQIVGVKVLWSIIVAEILIQESMVHQGNEDSVEEEDDGDKLFHIERACLVGMDKFYRSNRYVPGLYEQCNFITRLKMMVRLDPEDIRFPEISQFIFNLADFLEIQYDLSTVPEGDEFDDERTFHQLDITRHLMRVNTATKFYATLHDLFTRNLKKENFTQAALCLEMMSSTLTWNVNDLLPNVVKPQLPSQSSFERKEMIYKEMGHYLTKGKKYEKAVLVYKELAEAYERYKIDLGGLTHCHLELGKLYELLQNGDTRETPTYFKVTFIGLGFPTTLTSRSFIYEGLPFEHISAIHTRLLRLHTGTRIILNDEDPVLQTYKRMPPPGKFLHIVTVKPQMEVNSNTVGNLTTAERLYLENKSLKIFTTSKRLSKSSEDVLELWVEETTYETLNYFPTLMNRSEVCKVSIVNLSPIENALRTLNDKIRDLVNLETTIMRSSTDHNLVESVYFSALSRTLSGTVDSPVNGGISQYKQFFTQPTISVSNEEEIEEYEENLALLRSSFDNLTICSYRCLILHGKSLPSVKFVDGHKSMIELFVENFGEEIQRTKLDIEQLESSIVIVDDSSASSSTASSSLRTFSSSQAATYPEATTNNSPTAAMINNGRIAQMNRADSRISSSDQISTRTTGALSLSNISTGSSINSGSKTGFKKRSLLNWRQSRVPSGATSSAASASSANGGPFNAT